MCHNYRIIENAYSHNMLLEDFDPLNMFLEDFDTRQMVLQRCGPHNPQLMHGV